MCSSFVLLIFILLLLLFRALSVGDGKVTSADTMVNFVTCLLLARGKPAVLEKIQRYVTDNKD